MHNLTQTDIGNIVGVSKQCVNGWEHGRTSPDLSTLLTLARFYNIYIEDFIIDPSNSEAHQLPEYQIQPITKSEENIIKKLRSLPYNKRKALEVILDIK